MADTLRQTEAAPSAYPTLSVALSAAAAALDADMIWQRLETYTAHRWSERAVEWIVEGPGGWQPPLKPATIATMEVWRGEAWETVTLSSSPFGGFCLSGCGPYRFTGTVGGGDVPAAVAEAFRRLAEYMAAKPGKAGATSESTSAGSISLTHHRSASWLAEAINNSGAGDLLRPYRRA
ncbi:hypothetical protein [Consotaella salsifontis]|uniref:Uncharacterized protein n=1 Tax=Consotaella salsifontis TaxID=1365950 RepID=A0A1T4SJZ4_9HYPH|nr:hypothetical protein [Consotaella salsifontis]SKA28483.1 hypothetical protein SAMN05428963_11184 [Consotaella salsifontis]